MEKRTYFWHYFFS